MSEQAADRHKNMPAKNISAPNISEERIIFIAALIQFVNIVDFMIVLPLGPDFSKHLFIPMQDIGMIAGVYSFASAATALAAALYLDHYTRRQAIIFCLCGLAVATFACGLAIDKGTMIAARIAAGIFGGPIGALALALVADYVPPERRGQAMGKLSGAFAAASVLGVPIGLEISKWLGWQAAFFAIAALALFALLMTWWFLPWKAALGQPGSLLVRVRRILVMARNIDSMLAYGVSFILLFSGFLVIPNISAHLQLNLDYPREQLGILYLAGGFASFFTMRLAGNFADKYSATSVLLFGTFVYFISITLGFLWTDFVEISPSLLVPIPFVLFMVSMTGRTVPAQATATRVPKAEERGAFMSLHSTMMSLAMALGAYMSSFILVERDGQLQNIALVGLLACAVTLLALPMIFDLERRLRARGA